MAARAAQRTRGIGFQLVQDRQRRGSVGTDGAQRAGQAALDMHVLTGNFTGSDERGNGARGPLALAAPTLSSKKRHSRPARRN